MIKNDKLLEMLKNKDYEKLEASLMDNVREECAGSRNKSVVTVVKEIMKSNKKEYKFKDDYFLFHALVYKDRYYYTDGHYIVSTDTDLNYGISEEAHITGLLDSLDYSDTVEFDIVDLKTHVKTQKDKPYIKMLESGKKLGVNAKYILNIISCTNSNTFRIAKGVVEKPTYINTSLYQVDDDGKVISLCLPIAFRE